MTDHPHRPDTPTFWRLSDLARAFDATGLIGTEKAMWDALDSTGVDAKSVEYVAAQRALRMLPHLPIPPGDVRMMAPVLSAMTVAWMEGFLAGRRFEEPED